MSVPIIDDDVWLNRKQLSDLFKRDVKTIGKHINNALKEELSDEVVIAKFATTSKHGAIEGKTQTKQTEHYNLDMIISIGYRVKSNRGIQFRKWANKVLRQHLVKGYSINDNRLEQLGNVVKILKRAESQLDSSQVLNVVDKYRKALTLLDDYDHQQLTKPKGDKSTYYDC